MHHSRRLSPVPYLSHARSAQAARDALATSTQRRPLRIAYAAASWGHIDAEAHGFVAWRKALRNACKGEMRVDTGRCQWVWISMSGQGAEKAMQQYARADFCLQPPGDTLPRPGIMDAISVGCVPIIFHPFQATLWPRHWNASASALLFDWTNGAPRPLIRDHNVYATRAAQVMERLRTMPATELAALRENVAIAAVKLRYAAEAPKDDDDAVGVLVSEMRQVRRHPDGAQAAAHAKQLVARANMIGAQRRYEVELKKIKAARRAAAKGEKGKAKLKAPAAAVARAAEGGEGRGSEQLSTRPAALCRIVSTTLRVPRGW